MFAMLKLVVLLLSVVFLASAADLPSKKYLNLAAIKTMVAAAEAEAQKRNVQVTICIMDESGNLLFLQKADGAGLNTIQFAQKKAKYAALYGRPSKAAADSLKAAIWRYSCFPMASRTRAACRSKSMGRPSAASRAAARRREVDEAISQTAIDALLK